jgi:hypothetical protein
VGHANPEVWSVSCVAVTPGGAAARRSAALAGVTATSKRDRTSRRAARIQVVSDDEDVDYTEDEASQQQPPRRIHPPSKRITQDSNTGCCALLLALLLALLHSSVVAVNTSEENYCVQPLASGRFSIGHDLDELLLSPALAFLGGRLSVACYSDRTRTSERQKKRKAGLEEPEEYDPGGSRRSVANRRPLDRSREQRRLHRHFDVSTLIGQHDLFSCTCRGVQRIYYWRIG